MSFVEKFNQKRENNLLNKDLGLSVVLVREVAIAEKLEQRVESASKRGYFSLAT